MNLPDKQRIRAAFARAAGTYDAAAVVQRRVCEALLSALDAGCGPAPRTILDAGCGTGYGAGLLSARWPDARLLVVDFAETMARTAATSGHAATVADIEALPCRNDSLDLWWSSLSVQWCDVAQVLGEARRVLAPGGRLALSTLGPGTFHELRTAFATVDRHRHTLDFAEPDEIVGLAKAAGLTDIRVVRETMTVCYPDLRQLLGAVKAIGANALGSGRRSGMMGKAAWQALSAAYEGCRTADGLPASYDVILLTATR